MNYGEHGEEIGGGIVRRRFSMGDRNVTPGEKLTAEEVLAIPRNNRSALVRNGHLSVHPPADRIPVPVVGERHIVHTGGGRHDVIEGRKINDEPLSRQAAEDLVKAGAPKPN